MKLNVERPTIETSDDFQSKLFGIGDASVIFDILRSKLYSNPIQSICREISCNARDAHREVGRTDPIQITLPNSLEPFYKIKDWGTGISSDRMEDIFINYGASTKRNDNIQTGAFGCGSKVPFSYADSFTVQTVFNHILYNYTCYIDETRVGKLALLSKTPTDQPNGTEISIPIKSEDFRTFNEATEYTTRHWDVKPIIKGGTINYQEPLVNIKGDNWVIVKGVSYYDKHQVKPIIDGIEYPLDLSAIQGANDLVYEVQGNIYLYFGVGELSISASREAVHLDVPTQKTIKGRLKLVMSELQAKIQETIDALPNLWEANSYYANQLQGVLSNPTSVFAGSPILWRDIPIKGKVGFEYDTALVQTFQKSYYGKVQSSTGRTIQFAPSHPLYINDLEQDIVPKQVAHLFNDSSIKQVQVLALSKNDKTTWDTINATYHIDLMEPKKISTVITGKIRKYGTRLIIFKLTADGFRQVAYDTMEADTNKKVLCLLKREDYNPSIRTVKLKSGYYMAPADLWALVKNSSDASIYGVDEAVPQTRIKEEFEGFASIDDFIDKTVFKDKKVNFTHVRYVANNSYYLGYNYDVFPHRSLLRSPKSPFLEYLSLQDTANELYDKYNGMLRTYEMIKGTITSEKIAEFLKKHPEQDLDKAQAKIKKQYPLIEHMVNAYSESTNKKNEEILIHYINLVDKGMKE